MLPKMDEGMDLGNSLYFAGVTPEQAEETASLFSFRKYYKRRARAARNLYQFSIMKGYQQEHCYRTGAVGDYSQWCKDNVTRFLDQPHAHRGVEK